MNGDAWILTAKPLKNGREQPSYKAFIATDTYFAEGGIAKKLDIPYALAQVIENGCCAVKQSAAVRRGLDAVATSIE